MPQILITWSGGANWSEVEAVATVALCVVTAISLFFIYMQIRVSRAVHVDEFIERGNEKLDEIGSKLRIIHEKDIMEKLITADDMIEFEIIARRLISCFPVIKTAIRFKRGGMELISEYNQDIEILTGYCKRVIATLKSRQQKVRSDYKDVVLRVLTSYNSNEEDKNKFLELFESGGSSADLQNLLDAAHIKHMVESGATLEEIASLKNRKSNVGGIIDSEKWMLLSQWGFDVENMRTLEFWLDRLDLITDKMARLVDKIGALRRAKAKRPIKVKAFMVES